MDELFLESIHPTLSAVLSHSSKWWSLVGVIEGGTTRVRCGCFVGMALVCARGPFERRRPQRHVAKECSIIFAVRAGKKRVALPPSNQPSLLRKKWLARNTAKTYTCSYMVPRILFFVGRLVANMRKLETESQPTRGRLVLKKDGS
ncbi:unnamed protein product [Pylaiella littoralis]